jgi:hypothetical protein
MVTDDLAQEDSQICLFNVGFVCTDPLGLLCVELDGDGAEPRGITIAGRISCCVSACHTRAIGFGINRAARGY